jgi:hypothetical protein
MPGYLSWCVEVLSTQGTDLKSVDLNSISLNPFPSPGDLPDPGIQLMSPAWQADSLPLSHQGSLLYKW